jgi:hypothetical protein
MKCYAKYNMKMAKMLSLVRPKAFNGGDSKLTTVLTSSTAATKSYSFLKKIKIKKYNSYAKIIPSKFNNTNDPNNNHGGTIATAAQKWNTTRQFGSPEPIGSAYYNDKFNIENK